MNLNIGSHPNFSSKFRWQYWLSILILLVDALFFATIGAAKESPSSTSKSGVTRSGGGSHGTGIGIMLGEPTGFTLKSWLSSQTAFDVGVSYSWNGYLVLLADYLWHFPHAFGSAPLTPYLGAGLSLFVDTRSGPDDGYFWRYGNRYYYRDDRSSVAMGFRVPIGLELTPRNVPLGIFAEIAPGLGVGFNSGLFGFVQGAIGIRYYL